MSSSLWSQKTFSSKVGDYHWIYTYSVWANVANKYVTKLDTSIYRLNGKNYYTFNQFKVADSGTKVFCLVSSEEVLVMDYALNEADTFYTKRGSKTYKLKVINKRKVQVENDSLWRIEMKSLDYPNGFSNAIWIESIGCISNGYHPIYWLYNLGLYDVGYHLDCVLHKDTSILKPHGLNCALDNYLLNPNKKWYTWASNHNGDLKFSVQYYFTNRDTLIDSKKYQIMNIPNRFVRFDSILNKYFILVNTNGKELLVYSDKVKVGDTMATPYSQADKVVKIEYKWIEENFRKVVTTGRDVYISGIGSVNRVMWDNHLATFPEYASGNICFEEGHLMRYHFPFYFQNKELCVIKSHINNANNHSLSFFPNPVQTILNFNISDKMEFKIRNSMGISLLEGVCEGNIDVGSLAQGFYFIELRDKRNSIFLKFQK